MTTIGHKCIILFMENVPRIIEVLLSWPVILSLAIILLIEIFKDDIKALFRLIAYPKAVREKAEKPPVTDSMSTRKPTGAECITVKRVKNLGSVYSIQDCRNKSKDID